MIFDRIDQWPHKFLAFQLNSPKPRSRRFSRLFRKSVCIANSGLLPHFGFLRNLGSAKEWLGTFTARDPELNDHFWVNPFGTHFSQIGVSDLVLVNEHGEVVEGNRPINEAAFAIHSRIHLSRPDVVAAAHAHSIYGKTWSSIGRLLDPITQDACAFYGDHGLFDDYTGVVYDVSEGDRIGAALGS